MGRTVVSIPWGSLPIMGYLPSKLGCQRTVMVFMVAMTWPALQGEARAEEPLIAANHCAKSLKLIGANCAYTTGLMAGRVLAEGVDWSFNGALTATTNDLESRVACPYSAADAQLVATEVLEGLVNAGGELTRSRLHGKTLELDGVRYVVLTAYSLPES